MLSDKKTNSQIILDIHGLLTQVNFRLQAIQIIEQHIQEDDIRDFLLDLVIYDIKTVMDDTGLIFPFR